MPLPDLLPITPFTHPAQGDVVLPGSKSLTNRALLLAALCEQPVTLTGALFSDDTQLMAEALRKLGLTVEADAKAQTIRVSNPSKTFLSASGPDTPVDLFVGLAGTAARFLTALCAAAPRGIFRIDGVPQMRQRPMKGLIDALRSLGADIRCTGQEGFFPIEIHAAGLRGGPVSLDARESSQLLSALLMVAPLAKAPVGITLLGGVRWPFVHMTARLMEQFGQPPIARRGADAFTIANTARYTLPAGTYAVEPDATAASYFLALPLVVGGALSMRGLRGSAGGLQGDTQFAAVLGECGMSIAETKRGLTSSYDFDRRLSGLDKNFNAFSDTFLTIAALAPLLNGPTRITGIAHTRKQETDRVAGMARELSKLGQHVVETEDSLEIDPRPLKAGQTIETYHDHRFAMSFGILGCHDLHGSGRTWLTIGNPGCCAKTFPNFFELLESVRQKSLGS
ncbi:MAG TPA: 3-phosphoshikimate 1-carboxyvinyltransferase [Opitutaceae bacterium]|nr:3-phosphoshikimate 1-carboxyvinyltransferase [Opitutaceae bacterium]